MRKSQPAVEYEGKYLVIENVLVLLEQGICARPLLYFFKEVQNFPGEVLFRNSGREFASLKKPLELLSLQVDKGDYIDILVERTSNSESKNLALRLYSGLTTEDFYPLFDREYL